MVNSVSGGSSGISSTYKGMSGLVSGMDTEGMIDTMMKAANARLDKLYQRQQNLTWKTSAYQNITTALYDFQSKFMNSSSPTSVFNPNFFDSATITGLGSNAGAVSVTGSISNIRNFQVLSVSSLASIAAFSTKGGATEGVGTGADKKQAIFTDQFTADMFTNGKSYSNLEGETLKLRMGGTTYNVNLKDVQVVNTGDADADALQNAKNVETAINDGLKRAGLAGKVSAELGADGKMSLKVAADAGNLELAGASAGVTKILGIEGTKVAKPGESITTSNDITDPAADNKLSDIANLKKMEGQSFTFDLNGLKRTITFEKDDLVDSSDNPKITTAQDLANLLQGKLDTAYGKRASGESKVNVDLTSDNRLAFTATDKSAILSVAAGSNTVTGGKGFLGLDVGAANRLLLYDPLEESNLNNKASFNLTDGETIQVNDTQFKVYQNKIVMTENGTDTTYDFKSGVTASDVIDTINGSKAGVTVKYSSTSDSFSVTSTESGKLGRAEISGGNLSKSLFGSNETGGVAGDNYTSDTRSGAAGTDAEMKAMLNGAEVTITRHENSFSLDGMNVTLNKKFDSTATGGGDAVSFSAKTNSDEIVKNVKEMIDAFNGLMKTVNTAYSTKPDKDYDPLTSTQKKDMSEDEIKAWNEKASAGIVFGDPILRELASEIRFAMSLPTGSNSLAQIGITSSTDWTQNGTLTVDETALKSAIESNPEKIKELFTKEGNEGTNVSDMTSGGGVMSRLQNVMDKYISTTGDKGVLINKAGHQSAPLSLNDNSMYKEMTALMEQIDKMKDSIKTEQDRYFKQFASLESYINQMNSQSSWLTQQFSG